MANINLYAQKVFAEHPLALWALDDAADYISLITENNRNFENWTITNGEMTTEVDIPQNIPFPNSQLNIVNAIVETPNSGVFYTTLTSPTLAATPQDLDPTRSTFSVGTYINNKLEAPISSFDLGFLYINPDTLETIEEVKRFTRVGYGLPNWEFFSETFTVPENFQDLRILFRFGLVDAPEYTYKFFLNGVSFAQDAEEFIVTSLGQQADVIVNAAGLNNELAIQADAYGLDDVSGYYLATLNKSLVAKNQGIPIVYGSSNATYITSNGNKPSLIIPGYGMLNELGRYRDYTFECWIKIDTKQQGSNRIFGPISSTDGLYVDGPFLRLEIGNSVGSYFVSEVARPMLLNIKIFENGASLLINGEQVILLEFETSTLQLPAQSNPMGDSQDWLGFYGHENMNIGIDCIAIYSYSVPSIMLKRRFAYGQAVEFPENANTNYGGSSIIVDYQSADYTNNYTYPTIGKWEQGVLQNISSNNNTLSAPSYILPTIDLKNGKTMTEWENHLYTKQAITENNPKKKYIQFDEFVNFLYFDNIAVLLEEVKAIYGVFGITTYSNEEQTLFRLENKINKSYISVTTQNDILSYKFVSNAETIIFRQEYVLNGMEMLIGFDIDSMSNEFSPYLKEFFGNRSQISLYVGGYKNVTSATFSGKIYKIAFCNSANFQKIKNEFLTTYSMALPTTIEEYDAGDAYFGNDPLIWSATLDGGGVSSFIEQTDFEYVFNHVASYTLIPKFLGTSMSIDISCSSYWEDYIPLSYFGKYSKDIFNEQTYSLDFLQFNIGYPPMEDISELSEFYDTEITSLKTFVTFQYLASGANASYSYFTNSVSLPINGVVIPGNNWMTTKYEVQDGTIIYIPDGVAFEDLAIVTHVELDLSGIIKSPVAIKSLQYASQSLDSTGANSIKTKFGTEIYPYIRFGNYFDYKARNPLKIYRNNLPYLYLTNSSGIELVGDFNSFSNRGVSIPINKQLSSEYKVAALQLFAKYNKSNFPSEPIQLFEIKTLDKDLSFILEATNESKSRAKIYAIDKKSGFTTSSIGFYLNGVLVKEPFININEWFVLGINFAKPLDFSSFAGAIRITGPILFNNLSYYQTFNSDSFPFRWDPAITQTQQLSGTPYIRYNGGLFIDSPKIFVPNAEEIYKIYVGTQRFIIDDNQISQISGYEYNIYKDLSWQRQLAKPV